MSSAVTVEQEGGRAGRWALVSLALCALSSALGTSLANVALPTLAGVFRASFQEVQWVVLAYLLALTVFVVGAGRLGDSFGRRRLLLAGLALFTAASALCGVAPRLWILIVLRAVQGTGAAVLMALSLALAAEAAPPSRTGSAMGLLGTASALGTALGPSLGGALIASLGWRAVFLVHVPLGVWALLLGWRHLPVPLPAEREGRPGLDGLGTLLLAATLAAYALAVTTGRGAFGPANAALLLAAAAGMGLVVLVESRARSPLLRLAMLREPVLRAGLVTSACVSTVTMATLVVGPFYLSRALGLGPARVGLAMSAGPLVAALVGLPAGRLVDRFGAGGAATAGLAGMTAGAGLLAATSIRLGVLGYVAPLAVLTAGYALFQAANNTAVLAGIGPDRRGLVSGLLNLARNLGLVTGASAMGALFAAASGARDVAAAPAAGVANGLRVTFVAAAGLTLAALALSRRNPDRAARGSATAGCPLPAGVPGIPARTAARQSG